MPLPDDLRPIVRVSCVSITPVTISTALVPGQVIAGHTLVASDLVLLAAQAAPAQNGLYRSSPAPARDVNYDATFSGGKFGTSGAYDLFPGMIVSDENTGSVYRCTSTRGGVLGTNNLVFASLNVTAEEMADLVGAMFSGNTETGITATYQDADNTIDLAVDLEANTFTPTMAFTTPGTSSWAYTTQVGFFYRIGRLVWFHVGMDATPTKGTGAGNVTIAGLPFPADAAVGLNPTMSATFFNAAWVWPAGMTTVNGSIGAGTSFILLRGSGSAAASTTLAVANMTDGVSHTVRVTGIYRTD